MIKETENAIIYTTDDYSYKEKIIESLEESKRVIIISTQKDVLNFYSVILEQYGQYNLYLEDSLSVVTDEYIKNIDSIDVTKEEAAVFLGTPFTDIICNTIDSLDLNPEQSRILGQCKELIKGQKDLKTESLSKVLNAKILELKNEVKEKNDELIYYKTKINEDENNTSSFSNASSVNINNINTFTKLVYIKEISKVRFFNTMIMEYKKSLEIKNGFKIKIIIIDDRTAYKYNDLLSVNIESDYSSNRQNVLNEPIILLNKLYPSIIIDTLKANIFNYVFIIDRLGREQDIIKGKNKSKFVLINSNTELENYKKKNAESDETVNYIVGVQVKDRDQITIPFSKQYEDTPDFKYYFYCNLKNFGNDSRYIFEILNEAIGVSNV